MFGNFSIPGALKVKSAQILRIHQLENPGLPESAFVKSPKIGLQKAKKAFCFPKKHGPGPKSKKSKNKKKITLEAGEAH